MTCYVLSTGRLPGRDSGVSPVVCRASRGGKSDSGEGGGGRRREGRGRSAKRQGLYQRLQEYAAHFLRLSQLEAEEEERIHREQRRELLSQERIREGLLLLDMVAADDGDFFADRVVSFTAARPQDEVATRHSRFSQGDPVDLSRGKQEVRGVVLEKSGAKLRIVPDDLEADLIGPGWRIDPGSNSITSERICAALEQVITIGKSTKRDDVLNVICESFQAQHASETRTLFNKQLEKVVQRMERKVSGPLEELAKQMPAGRNRSRRHQVNGIVSKFNDLSRVQRKVVTEVLCRRISLVQGPPGTGKTVSASAIVRALVALRSGPVLVSAASNAAADNLLERLKSLRVVRVGKAVAVRESLRGFTLESHLAKNRTISGLRAKLQSGESDGDRTFSRSMRASLAEVEMNVAKKVVKGMDVIVATCSSCCVPVLEDVKFPVVVIDEATQATEPTALLPMLSGCEQLILIGDHHQLPPTVISDDAARQGLDLSLFSRLWALGVKPYLLNVQYRMHPQLVLFPSATFYKNQVVSAPSAEERPAPPGIPWRPNGKAPILFVRTDGEEESKGSSYSNARQAVVVAKLLARVLGSEKPSMLTKEVGVITPYAAQVRKIYENIDALDLDTVSSLEIKSVDGFQGREKELIIFSTVRANASRSLGFTSDWRRLNVALTRARRGLVVIGDESTLCTDPQWRRWIAHARKQNCVCDDADIE